MSALIFVQSSKIDRKGVFAAIEIGKGERIIEYTGRKITYLESLECADKTYHYQLDMDYVIEGEGDARYVNHSCDPNCYSDVTEGAVWIVASRAIAAREELTFNYGYDFEYGRDHRCFCGQPDCVGYIVDVSVRPRLKELEAKKQR